MNASALENVQVLGIGHLAAAVRIRLKVEAPDSIQPLVVACSDFPSPASFRDANVRALAGGARILFVALQVPRVVLIGPLVAPHRAGCFECVRARQYDVSNESPARDLPGHAQIGARVAVREILASALTPYKGSVERRADGGRRHGRACRACRGRASGLT
jgi:hypothetical protein